MALVPLCLLNSVHHSESAVGMEGKKYCFENHDGLHRLLMTPFHALALFHNERSYCCYYLSLSMKVLDLICEVVTHNQDVILGSFANYRNPHRLQQA